MNQLQLVLQLLGKKKLSKVEQMIFDLYKNEGDYQFMADDNGNLKASKITQKDIQADNDLNS